MRQTLTMFVSLFIVQYNENEPGVADDWKQLTDANKQDGSVSNLVLLEEDMVHLIIDHFTNFVMKGGPASSQVVAKKSVWIVAYVTPPETSGDCIVRVYCVGDTPVHLEVCRDVILIQLMNNYCPF